MNGTPRVLRIYHTAVVGEHRQRERLLRSRHGYDVHLVSPPAWQEGGRLVTASSDPDVPIHIIDIRGRKHPILFWYATKTLRRVLREVRPHIVDLHEEPYSLAVAAALRTISEEAPRAAVCVYSAQNIHKRYPTPFRQFERRALSAASAAYPCSTEAADVLRAKGFHGALYVLPLGVDVPNETERGSGSLCVGFLGRLEPYKGGEIAIRAFAKSIDGIDASLEIVGDGPERADLEACAERLGVADHVLFTGAVSQDEALRRMGRYDIVLVPSRSTDRWKEQFGRVPAQAMAAGAAVIASNSGSLPEVLGGCGELAREGDVDDLADKLRGLLRDPGRRAVLGRLGRQRACDALTWEKVVDGCDRMYREMLSGATRADPGARSRSGEQNPPAPTS